MTIGLALIGSGIIVQEEHLPAVKKCELLSLKAVYSRSLKSAQALGENVDLYSDDAGVGHTYHDLLLRPDIDAVIIALPIMKQPEFVEAALAAGKHVLSEKPVAGDIKAAQKIIKYYQTKAAGHATWGVAENYRFFPSIEYARREIKGLGRILGFHVKSFGNVKAGAKYFETEWRKVPSHQGGFLLDGGVHQVAGLRYLLGEPPTAVVAYTDLLREHLPPADTLNSIWQTKSASSGSFSLSFGTSLAGGEITIACEQGSATITLRPHKVIIRQGDQAGGVFTEKDFPATNGITETVAAWAEGLQAGKLDSRLDPAEALADLEVMEAMLLSGQEQGKSRNLEHQV